jgi:site-specific DNA-methyltransferase (adenine-specific)
MEAFVQNLGSHKIILENKNSLECYAHWPSPTVIFVDGPYGIGGFPGDPKDTRLLPEVYAPHIAEWSKYAKPNTTLWFWGTELGWARMHPYLEVNGWNYEQTFIWNKGISHIAGNVNSKTIRQAPVVTEICVRYTRKVTVEGSDGEILDLQTWLRREWLRSGLPLSKTNEACGVKNAATRKYFTLDDLWYFPPAGAMKMISDYANKYGSPTNKPYFAIDGKKITEEKWDSMRAKWNHIHGYTNVWNCPALHSKERLRVLSSHKAMHYNQKPISIIDYIIQTSSDEGDVVWDPFAGLATTAWCCRTLGRSCYSAEIAESTFMNAYNRLQELELMAV